MKKKRNSSFDSIKSIFRVAILPLNFLAIKEAEKYSPILPYLLKQKEP